MLVIFFAIVIIWFKQKQPAADGKVKSNQLQVKLVNRSKSNKDFWTYDSSSYCIPSDLRRFCLRFLGVVTDTKVTKLLSNEQTFSLYSLLSSSPNCPSMMKFKNKLKNDGYIAMTLLYRATAETFDLKSFYSSSDGSVNKNILIILQTEFDNVIGGFMSLGMHHVYGINRTGVKAFLSRIFDGGHSYISDPNTFLLNITESQIFIPNTENDESPYTVFYDKGVVFGFGFCDFYLELEDLTCRSSTYSPYYEFDRCRFFGLSKVNDLFGGVICKFKHIEMFYVNV